MSISDKAKQSLAPVANGEIGSYYIFTQETGEIRKFRFDKDNIKTIMKDRIYKTQKMEVCDDINRNLNSRLTAIILDDPNEICYTNFLVSRANDNSENLQTKDSTIFFRTNDINEILPIYKDSREAYHIENNIKIIEGVTLIEHTAFLRVSNPKRSSKEEEIFKENSEYMQSIIYKKLESGYLSIIVLKRQIEMMQEDRRGFKYFRDLVGEDTGLGDDNIIEIASKTYLNFLINNMVRTGTRNLYNEYTQKQDNLGELLMRIEYKKDDYTFNVHNLNDIYNFGLKIKHNANSEKAVESFKQILSKDMKQLNELNVYYYGVIMSSYFLTRELHTLCELGRLDYSFNYIPKVQGKTDTFLK